jgi:hypothetical protein
MSRKVLLAVVAAVLASVCPVFAATPFGSFGGLVTGGNSGAGLLPLFGWALDDDGVDSVDILVDGFVAARANYGRTRPRVTQMFPHFPDSNGPGFAIQLDSTRYPNGLHKIEARVKSKSGEFAFLNPVTIEFTNVTHNLTPFGKIEFPNAQAELRGNCNLSDAARRFSVISGYAMDNGLTDEDTGVGYVELLVDRSLWANSRTDCRYSSAEGGLSDCYGLRRLDLEPLYPEVKDAPHSGFRFVLDVGAMISFFGYSPGAHVLTIRAGDHADQVKNIAEIEVTFTCDEFSGNEESFGEIGLPRPGLLFSGVVQTSGWALDWEGVSAIFVIVDGRVVGQATHGFARPGISALYPGYPESAGPGWQFALDTRLFPNGKHQLEVLVRDDLGDETFIGKREITIDNPVPPGH